MLDSTVLGTISSQYVPSMYRRPRWRNKRGLKREGVREREKERNRESGEGEKCIRGGGEKGREKRRLGGASLIIAIKPRR